MSKQALVIGASGGIGQALSAGLSARGYAVTGLSRALDGLDITSEDSVAQHLGQLETPFDVVIVATGILADAHGPEKSLRTLTVDEMARLFAVNAIGPALILKHAVRLFPKDRKAAFAALSARVGSIGDNALGGWYSYRTSKAALNQIIRTASIELARSHKQLACIALHPGTVATDFTRNYPQHKTVPPTEAARNLINVIEGVSAAETGRFYDWAGKEVVW
ncbi:SDR family NAD(P)-dependent oxidoreductase [Shimia sp. SDUM112013]|uniref:SDR family NAD(P)-dependent oxidoreductase n=1 Tax=Shimia sp. SDUM112013 TaxID=3136160 RepID=UPI0032EF85D5